MISSTQRLNLEPITALDLRNIHKLFSLPETDAFNTMGIPKTEEKTKEIVQGW
jgi:ribosomal-protein-alanine N-acetyltransferase